MRLVRELGWVWCLMFVAAAVAASWFGGQAVAGIAAWVAAGDWPATPARVTQVNPVLRGYRRWQFSEIHYEYVVDGRPRKGWYLRAEANARPGETVGVIVDPADPARSVRSRADLAHAGISAVNTLGFYGAALASGLLLAILAAQGRRKAVRLRFKTLLAAADKAALEAYFNGSPQEAVGLLGEFGELLESAQRSDAKDSAWQRLIAHNQVRRLGRLAVLHRAAAREGEAESCVRAAFGHAQALGHAGTPLDPPIEYSGHVYRYIEAQDRGLRERAGPRS